MAKLWRIPLLNSGKPPKKALVDADIFAALQKYRWHLNKRGYAVRYESGQPPIALHTEVCPCPKGMVVDHIDRNPLNCRRANLRIVTDQQNRWNRGAQRNNASGYKGVAYNGKQNKGRPWQAKICARGRRYHLGWFDTAVAAAEAYDDAARRLHGAYAFLNFPDRQPALR